jgi:predicted branched-subunit amino acid permease
VQSWNLRGKFWARGGTRRQATAPPGTTYDAAYPYALRDARQILTILFAMRWMPKAWPEGLRVTMPLALPIAAVGVSFGLLAAPLLGAIPSIVMSGVVWSSTAQFAALTILASGGGTALAAGAGLLANTRFLPMGFAIAPSMAGGPLRRLLQGALLLDTSFVIGHRGGGQFDIGAIVWAAPVQYVSWIAGTIAGVAGATAIGDPSRWGIDVLFSGFLSQPAAARSVS